MKKTTKFGCYLIAAICYFSIAVFHFLENLPAEAIMYLCLSGVDIVLCIDHISETDRNDDLHNDSKDK